MLPEVKLEYAIRRLNWRRTHYGIVRLPGAVTLGALPSFEEAEADRAQREAAVRERVNPFVCGPNHAARSRLPELIFCDWLGDAGIEPPTANALFQRDWARWWERVGPELGAEQVAHVWAGLDRVRFFEVVGRPEGRIGYAVVVVDWEYNDNWMEPGDEGGTPCKVFRRWADAEACRAAWERAMTLDRGPDPMEGPDEWTMQFEVTRWADEALWPLKPLSNGRQPDESVPFVYGNEAPFYEIVEIELPDGLAGTGDG